MNFSYRSTLLFSFILVLSYALPYAQTPMSEAFRTTDITPAWPGCDPTMPDCTKAKLSEFISANIKTPAEATNQGAGGVVMVEFVVEKNGAIGEVRTLHDPGFGLGAEAIRVINLMNEKKIKWLPAKDEGKKVPYRYITPVSFSLAAPPKALPTVAAVPVVIPDVYEVAEVMPRYAGCDQVTNDTVDCTFMKMLKHIQTNLQYPADALTNKIQGPVVVDFVIDSSGHVVNAVVPKGLGHGCDEEAVRVISIMPVWIPGMQDGKHVAVKMTVPILFQLPKEKN